MSVGTARLFMSGPTGGKVNGWVADDRSEGRPGLAYEPVLFSPGGALQVALQLLPDGAEPPAEPPRSAVAT